MDSFQRRAVGKNLKSRKKRKFLYFQLSQKNSHKETKHQAFFYL